RLVGALLEAGVSDLYVMRKLPKTLVYRHAVDRAARGVLPPRARQGDHADIAALVADPGRRGRPRRPRWGRSPHYVVPPGFAAGRPLTAQEEADVRYGYRVARRLADEVDAGQTVVVKDGIVLAIEAAEGTDATIRRGGRLGGP